MQFRVTAFKILLWVSLAFLLSPEISAQEIEGDSLNLLRSWQLKSFGQNAQRMGDIYSAMDYYQRYLEKKPEADKISYELAHLYRQSRDYNKAQVAYKKVYEKDPIKFVEALFYQALMEKMTGNYLVAQEHFEQFKKAYKKEKEKSYYRKRVKAEILGCQMAPNMIDTPKQVIVNHMDTSINKAHVELAPRYLDNENVIYGSLRTEDVPYVNVEEPDSLKPFRMFYKASRTANKWTFQGAYEGPFYFPGAHSGDGAFTPDRKRFYFTSCQPNWKGKMICALYVSSYLDNQWTAPEKLPKNINAKGYTVTQPTVGYDSKKNREMLFFVSDRKGGKGGLDIWFTLLDPKTGLFKDPKNAGSKVNTVADEVTPFYKQETRSLYFSSSGHPGMGGLDVFKVIGEQRKWTVSENLGYPLNSMVDDLYYTVSPEKDQGMLVSNRAGGVALLHETCCDDLYTFRWPEYIRINTRGSVYELLETDTGDVNTLLHGDAHLRPKKGGSSDLNEPSTGEDNSNANANDSLSNDSLSNGSPSKNGGPTDGNKNGQPNPNGLGPNGGAKNGSSALNTMAETVISLYLLDKETGEPLLIKRDTTDHLGNFDLEVEQGNKYRLLATKKGYYSKTIEFSTESTLHSDTLDLDLGLKRIMRKPILIPNVYYDFNKATLRPEGTAALDTTLLVILQNNPTIVIEILSHTDSKGTDKYNMWLSGNRAESVVKYLRSKGIDKKRLKSRGYGESKPVAPNENEDGTDNPDGRQKNRRTEFQVIGEIELEEFEAD